jgi:hypothetical protein
MVKKLDKAKHPSFFLTETSFKEERWKERERERVSE